ncbi:MAG: acyltransferase family protein [Candidatus Hodarchaeales archaeon]
MNTESIAPKKPRYLFLDNIKFLFAVLVIFQHVRVTYGGTGGWYYIEGGDLDLMSYIFFQTITSIGGLFQSSLMGLFFLMSAYFTPKSFDRKGLSTFWKERLLRLGIPLLLYIILINPILYYIVEVFEGLQESFLDYYLNQFQSLEQIIKFLTRSGPMWFLLGLLIFTFLYTLWRQLTNRISLQRYVPKELSIPKFYYLLLIAVALGFGTFLFRLLSPVDSFPWGFPFGFFPQYLMMFSVGIIAARYNWFEQMYQDSHDLVRIWSRIIVITFVVFYLYVFASIGFDADFSVLLGGPTLPALVFSLVDNIICMGMVFVLIPTFYTRFNTQSPLLENLSASAFPMYLVHPPVVVAVSLVFTFIPLFAVVKLVIVFPVSVVLCYLVSHYIIQKIL